ncbi:uncharacterized protein LOC111466074 [Cucurbita maxima]|uniref:Uncharacterized protein LOC111466074 n=1 Tax=Cucurbita maxima TaxID=3661 RepID=A0A6J1HMX4_CUCMA|nr:uncharacterized protein LOC111466074 [Cucurbita maxima]
MDIHEWEILSDDALLDYKDDKKKIIAAKRSASASEAKVMVDMNYFLCPSSMDSSEHISQPPRSSSGLPKQPMIPVHLQLDSPIIKVPDDSLAMKEKEKVPMVISFEPSAVSEKVDQKGAVEKADQETVTQVFFKKMKENEFVDMKIDSPRSSNKGTKAQIDVGCYQFDDDGEAKESSTNSPRMNLMNQESNKMDDGSIGGLNILKWSLNGIGAICSFGVAAATICVLFYGGNQQKLKIQIYTNDKKLKQAVQQATKLNEAISAARGLPQTRAHITCGGRYDGL